jgi:hypothetical protein
MPDQRQHPLHGHHVRNRLPRPQPDGAVDVVGAGAVVDRVRVGVARLAVQIDAEQPPVPFRGRSGVVGHQGQGEDVNGLSRGSGGIGGAVGRGQDSLPLHRDSLAML